MKNTVSEEGIPASHYTKEYFFSEEFCASAIEYKQFVNGGKPSPRYLRALGYLPQISKGTYLDIGCGKGEIVIYLARMGNKAVGIDHADAAIEICKSILKREKPAVKNLAQFKVADATKLPFSDETFDAVFFLDVVEHLTMTQTEKALQEIKRVLKKSGKVIIHTNNKYFERGTKLSIAVFYHGLEVLFHPNKFLDKQSHPYEYMHINYVTPTWFARRLQKLGFHTTSEYPKPNTKSALELYVGHNKCWKKFLYYNIAWIFLNSPFIFFFSPTFWLIGEKTNR